MKILIASDSFKDCLTAGEVGKYIQFGLEKSSNSFETFVLPMADGGEGTVDAIINATSGRRIIVEAHDPLMRKVSATYGISGDDQTAIIEMAAVSGIELLELDERNPWITSTFGVGELIKDALNRKCKRFIIGIGGSATNDAGVGMAMALGAGFYKNNGKSIGFGGGAIADISQIDISAIDSRIKDCEFIIACDVTNPLTGINGASFVYGTQKGGDPKMIENLDLNLKHLSELIRQQLNTDVESMPGGGAAGGLGAGFKAFFDAQLKSGFEIISKENDLEEKCKWADIVITGEGKIDNQTKFGKTPQGVAKIAAKHNKFVIGVAGTLGENYYDLFNTGFGAIFSIVDKPMSLKQAMDETPVLLENFGFAMGKMLLRDK